MKKTAEKIIPHFLFSFYHYLWPFFGAFIYRFPSRKLKVIGITGTNGKTTVAHLASDMLEGAGYKVASISSIRFKIGEQEWKNELKMTMPGRMKIHKFLRDAVSARCKYVVMEVTSEGIKQHRHNFINFNTAVFTNLTPEHIESHGSFEKYREAKGELFRNKNIKTSIVNLDDENAGYFLEFNADNKWAYTTSPRSYPQDDPYYLLQTTYYKTSSDGVTFRLHGIEFNLPLLGKFNIYNALAAIGIGLSEGLDMQDIKKTLDEAKSVPGRMEVVVRKPYSVVVDYAHTPDALEKAYKTIKDTTDGRMICVLGSAGGGRDKWKRPQMGKIAGRYCEEVILTNEDPYNEPPEKILEDIEKGLAGLGRYEKILNREEAIKKALKLAEPGDAVIITGKGSEPWMMTKEGRIPWDDREIVKSALEGK